MSEPASEPPELDAQDALRGVVNQLTIHGERMSVIIPGSVIEALRDFAALLQGARETGYLDRLLPIAMPWIEPLPADDRKQFVSDLTQAASAGDHAPEQLAAVLRDWHETADILADPEAMVELAESADAVARGDVIRGRGAVRALRRGGEHVRWRRTIRTCGSRPG